MEITLKRFSRSYLKVIDEWVEIFDKDGKPLPEPKRVVLQAA